MTRNTKEISLIQIRSGDLAQLPKALHQAEFGLAKDQNRLFIGNAINTYLKNRTSEFPYQNLEILTECSELKDYFKYSYENNITNVNGEEKRSDYKEYLPIVVSCGVSNPIIPTNAEIKINGVSIALKENDDIGAIIDAINMVSDETHTYATMLSGTQSLTLICFISALSVEDVDASIVNDVLGFPSTYTANILMPTRKVTEKLDDFLNISDFGIRGNGQTNVCDKVFYALLEVYKNFKDSQFYRNILFPAGTYKFDAQVLDNTSSTAYYPFPLISNLMVHGEGIDRTIIEATTDFTTPLLNCVDDNLKIATSNEYGLNSSYPSNIVIEDMTFKSGSQICKLSSVSNITFNRVKFIGLGTSDLIEIVGKDEFNSTDITFNECIFEGGQRSIFVSEYAKNINITNCQFINSNGTAVEIGEDNNEHLIYGVNLSSNTFTNCFVSASSDQENSIIKLGQNAQYVSIHQSIFDREVIERTGIVLPYKDFDGKDRKNFIDTLDPKTDTKRVLRFNFAQPQWEYLNYLCNPDGKVVLTIDGKDSDITANNGLNIKQTDNGIVLNSVGEGNVVFSQENEDILELVNAKNDDKEVGYIKFNKALHLNDNKITNEHGKNNIVFETAPDTFLEIDPKTVSDTPYEKLILGHDNAIPNVAYVEKATTSSIIYRLNESNFIKDVEKNSASIPIMTFDSTTYGKNIYLKNISINVRKPFYSTYKLKSQAVDYLENYTYYNGDVVKGILTSGAKTSYGIVKMNHIAETSFHDAYQNGKITLLSDSDKEITDIKYIDIIAKDTSGQIYSLTQSYKPDFDDPLSEQLYYTANISAINNFSFNGQPFDPLSTYGEEDCLVQHQNKMFTIYKFEDKLPSTLTAVELHNPLVAMKKHNEGFNYIYDMDRLIVNGSNEHYEMGYINFADMTLYIVFANNNTEAISSLDDLTQLCPSGEAIIRIDYIKKEVN